MASILPETDPRAALAALARCLDCARALDGRDACPACGRAYPAPDGILDAIGPLTGTNRIAADFYDGPGWRRFRPFERTFLRLHGGQARARRQILRHLPQAEGLRVLEVGIGDGENLPLLPPSWTVFGIDIARTQLAACRDRFPAMSGRLAWAEGEALPFDDAEFDAVYSVGGFNYFRDPAAALREFRRVARPGVPVLVADEVPDLRRFAIGALLGIDALDIWWLRRIGLDAEFARMVVTHTIDPDALADRSWPGYRRFPIWNRLGYCLVHPDPTGSARAR